MLFDEKTCACTTAPCPTDLEAYAILQKACLAQVGSTFTKECKCVPSVCPDSSRFGGKPVDEARAYCLSQAFSTWTENGCICTIDSTASCSGTVLQQSYDDCNKIGGTFDKLTCTCTPPKPPTCPGTIELVQEASDRCNSTTNNFNPATCKCTPICLNIVSTAADAKYSCSMNAGAVFTYVDGQCICTQPQTSYCPNTKIPVVESYYACMKNSSLNIFDRSTCSCTPNLQCSLVCPVGYFRNSSTCTCDIVMCPRTTGLTLLAAQERCKASSGLFDPSSCNCTLKSMCADGVRVVENEKFLCLQNVGAQFDSVSCSCTLLAQCPGTSTFVTDAAAKCISPNVFDQTTCTCSPICPNGLDFTSMQTKCVTNNFLFNATSCTCYVPTDSSLCPKPDTRTIASAYTSCTANKPVGSAIFDKTTCICKDVPWCNSISAEEAQRNCMSTLGATFNKTNCVCTQPVAAPVCPKTTNIPIADAAKQCASATPQGFYQFNNITCDCLPKCDNIIALADRCKAAGYNFDVNSCSCLTPPPTTINCAAFTTCSTATPCLGQNAICTAPQQNIACNMCTSFGSGGGGGTVCPDGSDYDVAKKYCLQYANATFSSLDCVCTRVARPTCPNGNDYASEKSKCLGSNMAWAPETCACTAVAIATVCPPNQTLEVAKRMCLLNADGTTNPLKIFDVAKCTCLDAVQDCKPVISDCEEKAITQNVTYVPATSTSPCACVIIDKTNPVTVPTQLFESVVSVDLSCASLAEIVAKNLDLIQMISLKFQAMFPNSRLIYLGLSGSSVKFGIRSQTLEEATEALTFIQALAKNPDFEKLLLSVDPKCNSVNVAAAYSTQPVPADSIVGSNGQVPNPPTPADVGAADSLVPAVATVVVLAMAMYA